MIAGILLGMSDAKWTEFDRIQRYCLAERRLMAPNKRREIINILGMYLHKELPSACCAFLLWYPFPMTGALGNHGPVNYRRDQIHNKRNNIDYSFGSSQRSIPPVHHQVVAADHVGRRRRQEQYRVGHLDRFAEPPRGYLRLHRIAPLRISPYLHP